METPHTVRFEHRRIKPGTLPPSLVEANRAAEQLGQRMSTRARWWRAGFVVAGAAAIAWGGQRLGLTLEGGLCLFVGMLPVLWVGGWLFGFLVSFGLHARTHQGALRARVGSFHWQQELEQHTVREQVELTAQPRGLSISRDGRAALVPWASVRLERVNAETLLVSLLNEPSGLALEELLPVPRDAFPSREAFEAFCVELQKHVWEAQR